MRIPVLVRGEKELEEEGEAERKAGRREQASQTKAGDGVALTYINLKFRRKI